MSKPHAHHTTVQMHSPPATTTSVYKPGVPSSTAPSQVMQGNVGYQSPGPMMAQSPVMGGGYGYNGAYERDRGNMNLIIGLIIGFVCCCCILPVVLYFIVFAVVVASH